MKGTKEGASADWIGFCG